ncbi:MAG TPA: glycosyltransferase family 2 protein [Candidatus Saccharimonadales bacterium]|jgi:glycosyltransferase involved in cell wall biosynthesis|nr:glycosyltransferase family 2 protein [Candidatus Saccharimonadales bacterium]
MDVQIFIPARNEQAAIGRCLESLLAQQGIAFQVTVIDDHSTDRTRAIAESFAGVRVITPPEPGRGISGKSNALSFAVDDAAAKRVAACAGLPQALPSRGPEWLLFTDADTWHYPGSLAAAVAEAQERQVDLLSYSPEQETATLAEMAIMPLVFAELTRVYRSERINDPDDPAVAANGQYILARRAIYEQLGGHRAIAGKLLEDVELAKLFKCARRPIWFRYGAGLVRTRMYRDFHALCEGWTKNLALLFRHPRRQAALHLLLFLVISASLLGVVIAGTRHDWQAARIYALVMATWYAVLLFHVSRAHFPWNANLAALLGLPLFSWLLLRSDLQLRVRGEVIWKGRTYEHSGPAAPAGSSYRKGNVTLKG